MAYQTPGVYLEEKSLFPPSVAAVATAVPAFVGYTQRNTRSNGESLNNIPIWLTSLLEFQQLYGGAYVPATRQVFVDTALALQAVHSLDGSGNPRRYFLYPAIRHYFYNGVGTCYTVRIRTYETPVDLIRKNVVVGKIV